MSNAVALPAAPANGGVTSANRVGELHTLCLVSVFIYNLMCSVSVVEAGTVFLTSGFELLS
jgi:hypothetical protein